MLTWTDPVAIPGKLDLTFLAVMSLQYIHYISESMMKDSRLKLVLGDDVIELATMYVGNLELKRTGLATPISTCNRTRTPRRS